jgi:hypothetical protein
MAGAIYSAWERLFDLDVFTWCRLLDLDLAVDFVAGAFLTTCTGSGGAVAGGAAAAGAMGGGVGAGAGAAGGAAGEGAGCVATVGDLGHNLQTSTLAAIKPPTATRIAIRREGRRFGSGAAATLRFGAGGG